MVEGGERWARGVAPGWPGWGLGISEEEYSSVFSGRERVCGKLRCGKWRVGTKLANWRLGRELFSDSSEPATLLNPEKIVLKGK
jgi:hypothetical protein